MKNVVRCVARGVPPMRARFRIALGCLLVLVQPAPIASATGPAALPVVYVDWQSGSGCTGTLACPFRTVTEAVQFVKTSLGGAARIEVAPGIYDVPLGEVFPISLPPIVELVSSGPCGAIFGGNTGTFPGDPILIPSGSQCVLLDGLVFERQAGQLGYKTAIKVQAAAGVLDLTIRGCAISASTHCVKVLASGGQLNMQIEDTQLSALMAVDIDNSGATVDVAVRRCRFMESERGFTLAGNASGPSVIAIDRTTFDTCGSRAVAHLGSNASFLVTHCVFHACGNKSFPPGSAIRATASPLASWLVANCTFSKNANDFDGVPGGSVVNCLMAAPYPGAINTVIGDPQFIAADQGDFHLMPGSVAIDAALPLGGTTLDIDLDPLFAGSAADIGVDELWTPYLTIDPRPINVFGSTSIDVTGPVGSAAWLVLSSGLVTTFGFGYQLGAPLNILPIGSIPPSGVLSNTLLLSDPTLLGLSLAAQAVTVNPANGAVAWTRNALQFTFCF